MGPSLSHMPLRTRSPTVQFERGRVISSFVSYGGEAGPSCCGLPASRYDICNAVLSKDNRTRGRHTTYIPSKNGCDTISSYDALFFGSFSSIYVHCQPRFSKECVFPTRKSNIHANECIPPLGSGAKQIFSAICTSSG